jgi:GT2 family glycosyltransferase
MAVSLVIPTWNGREILERNLPSVRAALEAFAGGGEAIVVDDGSRDGTVAWLADAHPWVRTVARAANEGFGASVNVGVAAARSELVVLLNNDMRVEPGFLAPLLAPFGAERGLFSTTPRIVNRKFGGDEAITTCAFQMGLFGTNFPERNAAPSVSAAGAVSEVLFACGGAAAFDRSLWLALGGLDPIYAPFYWEDVDLSWRARKRGWRILHVPESVVHHEHSATIGARFSARSVHGIYERNRLLFQWKNLTSRRLTMLHLAWLPLRLVRALAGRPDFLRGFLMAAGRLREAVRARRLEKALAAVTDEEILDRFHR